MAKGNRMLLCHLSIDELKAMNTLQGGKSIDPHTMVPEYSAIGELIKDPYVKKIFQRVSHEVKADLMDDGDLSPSLKRTYKKAKRALLPFRQSKAEEENPAVRHLEAQGIGGDTHVAWLPENFVKILIEMRGGVSINPHTNLIMFGFFKNPFKAIAATVRNITRNPIKVVLPIAATIISGGTLAPAIAGAIGLSSIASGAIASGLGRAAGSALVGDNPLQAGVMGGLGHYAAGLGNGTTANTAATGLSDSALAAQNAANQSLGITANAAAPSLLSRATDLFNGNWLIPAALGVAGLGYLGEKQRHKTDMKNYEDYLASNQAILDKEEQYKRNSGFYKSLDKTPLPSLRRKYDMPDYAMEYGITDPYFKKGGHVVSTEDHYHPQEKIQSPHEGVLVKGPGKGQQDLIKTTVPENSYIIDASATSMFGDGSSDAGAAILKKFEQEIQESYPKHHGKILIEYLHHTSRQLPVWLSDSEYKFDPLTVTMLGKGDNAKGAKMLKRMVENIRAEKSKKGGGLPLKAKSPWYYLNKKRR